MVNDVIPAHGAVLVPAGKLDKAQGLFNVILSAEVLNMLRKLQRVFQVDKLRLQILPLLFDLKSDLVIVECIFRDHSRLCNGWC